jgi:two-component system sensor histidine kinase AlgZ
MNDSQILSAFSELPDSGRAPLPLAEAQRPLVFDACQLGVVLRAVLFVEAVMAVGALYGAADWREWAPRLGVLSFASLPATLAWLLVACSLKRMLARVPVVGQQAFGIGLGVLAGLAGCALLWASGLMASVPWVASAATGGLLASGLVAVLVLRAKGRMPADTAARLSELQARIRPHFLFNTLNTAIALVREDPARAEAVLEDLSDLFRHALAEPREAVTLDEEVALARRYLAIEEVRFGERLRVEWDIDPQAGDAKVPPLVLQPLVENAVKHGVEPSTTGAEVKVSTQRRGSSVVIKVTNTVPAGQGRPGHGLAQDNVRDRLLLMHDVQVQFRTALREGVYQVRIEVPA